MDYVQTFHVLQLRYDQHQDRTRDREKANASLDSLGGVVRASGGLGAAGGRYRRDVRDMEAEEELWFNTDADELEEYEEYENNSTSRDTSSPIPAVGKLFFTFIIFYMEAFEPK